MIASNQLQQATSSKEVLLAIENLKNLAKHELLQSTILACDRTLSYIHEDKIEKACGVLIEEISEISNAITYIKRGEATLEDILRTPGISKAEETLIFLSVLGADIGTLSQSLMILEGTLSILKSIKKR